MKIATASWLKQSLESWKAREQNKVANEIAAPGADYVLPKISDGGCIEDTWTATAAAPSARHYHTAVWTGTEMIVWGGLVPGAGGGVNTGGKYNPSTDSWIVTSTANAPDARYSHTAVWTGTEMIIWGGTSGFDLNTGGRYNPLTDSWLTTST
ncbi:MAG: hypothetical protein DME65_13885, partial [Verrucomicrobia bacterium]